MRVLKIAAVVFPIACVAPDDTELSSTEQVALATEFDAYSGLNTLTDSTGQPLRPVHVNLMPDGRVLMIGRDGNAGLLTPALTGGSAVQLAAAAPPYEVQTFTIFGGRYAVGDNLFCGGHTQLATGEFFSVGGSRYVVDQQENEFYIWGLPYGTRFDGTNWNITQARLTVAGSNVVPYPVRWYGQASRLADGKVLIAGGYDEPLYGPVGGVANLGPRNISSEIYDPVAKTFTALTDADPTHTPVAIFNTDYTHFFVLPYQSIVEGYALGESSAPVLFGRNLPGTWSLRLTARPGTQLFDNGTAKLVSPSYGASSALLPIRLTNGQWQYLNGTALVAGGAYLTDNEHAMDFYDPIQNIWARLDMQTRRHHPSTVAMPDGRMLVIAGHDDSMSSGIHIQQAEYLDPANNFAITEGMNAMGEVRGYHTVTLLLPDGRVLVGGGRTAGSNSPSDEKDNFRYYYPGYVFRTRPAITSAPGELRYGMSYPVAYTGNVTEAVLIGLGSMTHSFDSNQRYVQIALAAAPGTGTITAPPDAQTAPPGYYMLFLLDANRTPSIARIVKVD
jgi:galactose oxidase